MADGPTLTEMLVSELGKPKEPFGMGDLLLLSVVAVAAVGYLGLEYGLGRLIARLLRFAGSRVGPATDLADRVRIRRSEETQRLGLADKEGQVFGWTTPSVTGVAVIGPAAEDHAVNVHFEELGESFWFAESLVETIDRGAGTVISLDGQDREWVRLADGEWQERPRSD